MSPETFAAPNARDFLTPKGVTRIKAKSISVISTQSIPKKRNAKPPRFADISGDSMVLAT